MKPAPLGWVLPMPLLLLALGSCEPAERPEVGRQTQVMADALPMEERVGTAIAAAQERVGENPASASAWGDLGIVYEAHGYLEEAVESYTQAVEIAPDDFRWAYLLAVAIDRHTADPDGATSLLQQAVDLDPNYAPLHHRLGTSRLRAGRVDAAREALERALELDSGLTISRRQLALAHLAGGEPELAFLQLEKVLADAPEDGPTHAALAQALTQLERVDEARDVADRARVLSDTLSLPDPVRAEIGARGVSANRAYERAQALLESGRPEEAIELLMIKHETSPGPSSNYLLGVAHRRTGRDPEALPYFLAAVEMNGHPDADWQAGEILIQRGDRAEGIEHLLSARRGAASRADLLHAIGSSLAQAGALEEAIDTFSQAAVSVPANAELRTDWCGALIQLGSLEEARERCQEAVDLAPTSARGHLHLGLALEGSGQVDEAYRHYRRALELDSASRARQLLERPR